ncbi:uncharacterized protein B0H18DRAFT_999924, partial [Fomitopsis serialis]|uniref:uncharacterized protein n=1 Tax=Fomitopsis serialis TaxID=139415 RepID=UPI0020074B12
MNSVSVYTAELPSLKNYVNYQVCSLRIKGDTDSYEKAASLVSDGLVLALTALKTLNGMRGADIVTHKGPIIRHILLQDIGIATGHLDEYIWILQNWTATLTSVLLSRLALDLREAFAAQSGDSTDFFCRTLRDISYAIPDDHGFEPESADDLWSVELSQIGGASGT